MKHIKSLLSSSKTKFVLFLLTFAIGTLGSALFFFKSASSNIAPIEMKETTENQLAQTTQIENTFSEQTESINQIENPKVVQSEVVDFPLNGRVIVESIEEVGKFPQMVFRSEKTGKVLLRSSIEDEDEWLIPEKDSIAKQPALRFRTINSEGFKSPIIMSVAIDHGGSDNHYYLTIFGELNGKLIRLNEEPLFANIQGGFYLGHLNENFGYGLVVWNFKWGGGEAHDSPHHYNIEIYKIQNRKLKQVVKKVSKKKYDCDKGFNSLRELGIKAADQRKEILEIKDSLL